MASQQGCNATLRPITTPTHSTTIGYIMWLFGFTGAHRFYFGKRWTGLLWWCSFGLFGIGWMIDLFFIPGLRRAAGARYRRGNHEYTVAWVLLAFLGWFGAHRFYLGKWITGTLYLCTLGLATFGVLWDTWRLNEMIDAKNAEEPPPERARPPHVRVR